MLKNQKGITLVALVVTIVVLLILAGVTLSMVIGPNSPIKQAQETKNTYNKSDVQDQVSLAITNTVAKYYEEGAPELKLDNKDNIPSLAVYLYNDINSESSKTNASLPSGYYIKSVTVEDSKLIMDVDVKGNSFKAIYDAVEQVLTVE